MQTEAPAVFDLAGETKETLALYGVGAEPTDDYGRRCLLARRLVEKGVRFVVCVSGGGPGNCSGTPTRTSRRTTCAWRRRTDRPVAGLLKDLKRRGLLDSTLVLWGGEFGRSPEAQGGKGRDHHNLGFTHVAGRRRHQGRHRSSAPPTPSALQAVEDRTTLRDVHTTILHQLGLDQDRLSYLHLGRKERLTQIQGRVIERLT